MIICLGTTPTVQKTLEFDRVEIDAVNRARSVLAYASGKSVNVAKILNILGREAVALGILGGESGKFIRRELDRARVPHDFLEVDPPTRTCTTVVDRSTKTATELVEESSSVPAAVYDAVFEKLRSLLGAGRTEALVLSGTLTPGAPVDFYARCVAAGIEAGVTVVLDAKGEPLKHALPMRPTIVKPNRGELEDTVGAKIDSEESLKDAIEQLVAAGPRWCVVTAGPANIIASDGKSFWRIVSPKVPVISPIGSGDSFAAGLAAAVVAGESVPEACKLAAACGAANAMTALSGHLKMEDVELLLPQVTVVEI
jgi:1-phosphofructokinase family hexose kinase